MRSQTSAVRMHDGELMHRDPSDNQDPTHGPGPLITPTCYTAGDAYAQHPQMLDSRSSDNIHTVSLRLRNLLQSMTAAEVEHHKSFKFTDRSFNTYLHHASFTCRSMSSAGRDAPRWTSIEFRQSHLTGAGYHSRAIHPDGLVNYLHIWKNLRQLSEAYLERLFRFHCTGYGSYYPLSGSPSNASDAPYMGYTSVLL